MHTHCSCREFSHPFDCLLSGYAKTGKRFCSAFRKYNMLLSWRENRSKTLCILELIKKKILTAHDLNVVHRKFFTCNHFLFSKKDVTCTKYRFPRLKCQLKQNKNFERFEPSESLYFIKLVECDRLGDCSAGPGCSNTGQHYPLDKSISSG